MTRPKLSLGFGRLGDYALLSLANHIVLSLTGNANFPTTNPTLVTVQAAIDDFYLALTNVLRFNPATYTVKRAKRAVLVNVLQQLGLDIELQADGNMQKLQTSGFKLWQAWQRVGVLPAASITKLTQGPAKGSLKVVATAVKNAQSYQFQYALTPLTKDTEWKTFVSTRREAVLTGLTQGAEYGIRVCAVGSNPERCFSSEVFSYVA